jgi:hypothetical protein
MTKARILSIHQASVEIRRDGLRRAQPAIAVLWTRSKTGKAKATKPRAT